MIAIMLGSLLVAGSVVVGQNDPCLAVERGDGSTISLCAEFEIERLHDPRVTASAVQMLNALGAAAVPSLLRALKSDENLVRVGAVDALGRIGGRSTPEERLGIASLVCEVLGASESRVRLQAVGAI